MKKTLYILFTLVLILSCQSNQTTNQQNNVANYQDGLDELAKNSKLNKRLIDVYRAYFVRNTCEEIDNYLFSEFINHPKYTKELGINGKPKQYVVYPEKTIKNQINKLNLLNGITFNDEKIKYLSDLCIQRLNKILNEIKPHKKMFFAQTNFGILLTDPMYRTHDLERYIHKKYDISAFVNLSEKTYWELNDKSNYIKDPRYEAYKNKMIHNQYNQAEELLKKIITETKDFQEQSIYKIQLADQLVSIDIKTGSNSHFLEAKTIYETILKTNKYSLYLFESWVKWRSLSQAMIGFSQLDNVPNESYEKMRLANIKTIYSYLQENPNDEMAINYFLTLSSHKTYSKYEKQIQNKEEFYEYFKTVNL
jgi:hypothetical protein